MFQYGPKKVSNVTGGPIAGLVIPVPLYKTVIITAAVVACCEGSVAEAWTLVGCFQNDAGTVSEIGTSSGTDINPGAVGTATYTINGTNVEITIDCSLDSAWCLEAHALAVDNL